MFQNRFQFTKDVLDAPLSSMIVGKKRYGLDPKKVKGYRPDQLR